MTTQKKNPCPMTHEEFLSHATPLSIEIGGMPIDLTPRGFSSGGFGYGYTGRVTVRVNGKVLTLQASLNLSAIGSKELESASELAEAVAAVKAKKAEQRAAK